MSEIIKGMTGVIASYKRGKYMQRTNHILIKFEFDDDKKAAKLIGREVVWETKSGKLIRGKIVSTHGKNGVVRAIFQRGLPGEALGTEVKIWK